jgi:hypothetical protein
MKTLSKLIAILCLIVVPVAAFAVYNPNYEKIAKGLAASQKSLEEARNLCSLALTSDGYDTLAKLLLQAEKTLTEVNKVALGYQTDRIEQVLKSIKSARFAALSGQDTESAALVLDQAIKTLEGLSYDNLTLE